MNSTRSKLAGDRWLVRSRQHRGAVLEEYIGSDELAVSLFRNAPGKWRLTGITREEGVGVYDPGRWRAE
jgi:hypothetical protein